MQALHIECRQPPVAGQPFYPDAHAIFNETLIAGPVPPSTDNGSGSGLHGTALALAIALPVVGGILILGFGCWCCFLVTRKRRRNMAALGRMDKVREAQDSPGLYSPVNSPRWGEGEPPREMTQFASASGSKQPSPTINRWSGGQHYPPGTAVGGDDGTPLRNSFQRERDDVGPGHDQVQDHDLHEQYFGGSGAAGGPSYQGGYTDEQRHSGHYPGVVGQDHAR